MLDVVHRLRRRLLVRPGVPMPDPLQTLELQCRLSRLGREISGLHGEGGRQFALAHHARAATLAYEQTLDEACRLAGVPVPGERGPVHRLLAEAALSQVGWVW